MGPQESLQGPCQKHESSKEVAKAIQGGDAPPWLHRKHRIALMQN